jgi:hypothetical protein
VSGAPVLEWRDLGGIWLADIGRFRAEVWEQGGGFPWSIGLRGRGDAIEAPFVREVRLCPETASLDTAKLAAEAACIDLLVSAITALAPPLDPLVRLERYSPMRGNYTVGAEPREVGWLITIGKQVLGNEDAFALGCALLAAARAKEGDRG